MVREFPTLGKDEWAYTGFLRYDLLAKDDSTMHKLLRECDVLVDGPFKQVERGPGLYFHGSTNQHIIGVRESLRQGKVVEWIETSN